MHIPPGRAKIDDGPPPDALFFDFFRFFGLPQWSSKFASKNHPKKCENRGFWPPKTLPKPTQNAFKIEVPKNVRFWVDFGLIFVACCKGRCGFRTIIYSVLLRLEELRVFAFERFSAPKKLSKTPPKRGRKH